MLKTAYQQRREAALQYQQSLGPQPLRRLSLMHPQFNLREIAKQMVLLEDHLCHPSKHCPDCIRKHLLTIEAFAEEAVSLDQVGIYRDPSETLAKMARSWIERFTDGVPPRDLAGEVRTLRKMLVALVADPRGSVARVASRHQAYHAPCPHDRPVG